MSLPSTVKPPHEASRSREGRLLSRPGWSVLTLSVASLLWAGCHNTVGPDQSGAGLNEPEVTGGNEQPGNPGSSSSGGTPSGASTGTDSQGAGDTFTGNPTQESGETDSTSTPEDTDTPDASAHLQYMVVKQRNQIVELGLNAQKQIAYNVVGYYSDGKSKDMSNDVAWSVSDPELGTFAGNTLTLAQKNELFVKSGMVIATSGKVQARAQITVAAYKQSGEDQDFVFVLPYENDKGPTTKLLKFKTKVQALDVFFSVDTTTSMGGEINELSSSLSKTIVPALEAQIPSTQFGVGAVEDFPVGGFGRLASPPRFPHTDQPFRLEQAITPDVAKVQAGVGRLVLGRGGDFPESVLEGLYQVATGKGLSGPGDTMVAGNNSGVGGVGFRKISMPVIVSITDAASHAPGETDCDRDYNDEVNAVAATRAQTEQALKDICARVITVASEGNLDTDPACSPRVDGERLAKATEARVSPLVWDKKRPAGCAAGQCCTGLNGAGVAPAADGLCDLVFDVNSAGTGLDKSIVSGVEALAFFAPFDVVSEREGNSSSMDGKPLPNGKTTLDFFRSIKANSHGPLPIPGLPKPQAAGETFKRVTPGTEISFAIESYNGFIKPTTRVQTFRAKVGVKADQCQGLALDKREVVFVVPPKPLVAG